MPAGASDHDGGRFVRVSINHLLFMGSLRAASRVPIAHVVSQDEACREGGENLLPGQITRPSVAGNNFSGCVDTVILLTPRQIDFCQVSSVRGNAWHPCTADDLPLQFEVDCFHLILHLTGTLSHIAVGLSSKIDIE
jgi:hypothetical protein